MLKWHCYQGDEENMVEKWRCCTIPFEICQSLSTERKLRFQELTCVWNLFEMKGQVSSLDAEIRPKSRVCLPTTPCSASSGGGSWRRGGRSSNSTGAPWRWFCRKKSRWKMVLLATVRWSLGKKLWHCCLFKNEVWYGTNECAPHYEPPRLCSIRDQIQMHSILVMPFFVPRRERNLLLRIERCAVSWPQIAELML